MKNLLLSLRPSQWIKNLFFVVPLVFAGQLFVWPKLVSMSIGFAIFCLLSGAVYTFNDLKDLEEDKKHPQRCKRPLASGALSTRAAWVLFFTMSLLSMVSAFYLNTKFGIWVSSALALGISYSLLLNKLVIVDVLTIALGFIIRVIAGCTILDVNITAISEWLIICTLLLSLFLGFSKRRVEISSHEGSSPDDIRRVLKNYNLNFLDQMIAASTAACIMAYILYTTSHDTIAKFGTRSLIFTVPFVLYGLFRYLQLVYVKNLGEEPANALYKDLPSLINIALWILAVFFIIYLR